MPPVEDHEVHEKVKIDDSTPYGCHSREGFATGYFAPDRRYRPNETFYIVQTRIFHAMSTACRNYYLWDTDKRCVGCTAEKDFEYRDRMTAL